MIHKSDTICALATAYGQSGIGVIRVTGPLSKSISKKILHQENQCDPKQIELMNLFSKSGKEVEYDSRWNKLKDLKNK